MPPNAAVAATARARSRRAAHRRKLRRSCPPTVHVVGNGYAARMSPPVPTMTHGRLVTERAQAAVADPRLPHVPLGTLLSAEYHDA